MTAPDFIEPLIGWRVWRVDATLALRSLIYPATWPAGYPLRARCDRTDDYHQAPGRFCKCGVYAGKQAEIATTYAAGWMLRPYPPDERTARLVLGRVKLWGEIEEYTDGYRAEFAQPEVLLFPASFQLHGEGPQVVAPMVADRYDVGYETIASFHADHVRAALL